GVERFVYMLEGSAVIAVQSKKHDLTAGSFAFLPADAPHELTSSAGARLAVFEKIYRPLPGSPPPTARVGHASDVAGSPFMGDDALNLQVFLPIEPAYDMAANVFTYQPGGTLPQVEIHTMEHGLLMLRGAGVYRLGDDYFPVQAGDVIWMASYCPQWFVAMGKRPALYLYYKDIHRDRLNEK